MASIAPQKLSTLELLEKEVEGFFSTIEKPEILEAGCGSGSNIRIPANAIVTGIDISQEELDKNQVVSRKIVGNLQTYEFPSESFDLIVCWDVLEHLPEPDKALLRFLNAIKVDGLILLAFPNVRSIKGVVAKFTPLWFHETINKFIYGKRAGEPGLINFPTYLRWCIAPDRICDFAQSNNLEVVLCLSRESGVQRRFRKKIFLSDGLFNFMDTIVKTVSFKKLGLKESDCIILLKKR